MPLGLLGFRATVRFFMFYRTAAFSTKFKTPLKRRPNKVKMSVISDKFKK